MKRIASIILYIFAVLILVSLWGFYSAVRPDKIISTATPSDYGFPYDKVTFLTKDNISIHGWFIKNANPSAKTIILMHGYPADKGDVLTSTLFLHKTYNLLYFDFRYFGESKGNYSAIGGKEVLDLLAAIDYLHTKHINEVGVWGFSMGAAVALMTAPLTPVIKALVSESSYASLGLMTDNYYDIPVLKYPLGLLTQFWGYLFLQIDVNNVSPVKMADKITIPVLLIHCRQDEMVPFDHALMLNNSLQQNKNLEILFLDAGRHGQRFTEQNEVIERFFAKYL